MHQLWLARTVCRTFAAPTAGRVADPDGIPGGPGGSSEAEWVVVEGAVPEAYAVPWELRRGTGRWWRGPGRPRTAARPRGRIVVSRGMLEVLTPAQQSVLLEHERAHLHHRHYLWVQLSEVAAVLNPTLRGIPALVRAAAERQADLRAAARVGDATLTAQAIAAAALARTEALRRSSAAGHPLQATGGDVVGRVEYLLRPAPVRPRRLGAVVLCLVIAASTLTSVGTLYSLTARLEHARGHQLEARVAAAR